MPDYVLDDEDDDVDDDDDDVTDEDDDLDDEDEDEEEGETWQVKGLLSFSAKGRTVLDFGS